MKFEMKLCVGNMNYGEENKWIQGKIKKLSPVTYLIKIINGNIYKRHLNQIIDSTSKKETEVEINKDDVLKELQNVNDNNNIKNNIEMSVSDKESAKEQVELETADKSEEVELRKSQRVIKPPVRLNL